MADEKDMVTIEDIREMLNMSYRPKKAMYYVNRRAYDPSNIQDMKELADWWHSKLPTDITYDKDSANANVVNIQGNLQG